MTKRMAMAILLFVVFSLSYCAFRVHGHDCRHDQDSVEFWEDQYKLLPAKVVRIEGDEVTITIQDKVRQQVYILHTNKDKPKEGKWYMFGFCRQCYYMFGFTPLK